MQPATLYNAIMTNLFNSKKLNDICEDCGISYLGLFGSYARKDNKKGSDLDLLVEFNKPVGYFGLVRIQRQLSNLLGKKVDLVTKGALSNRIYPYIQKDLKTLYGS